MRTFDQEQYERALEDWAWLPVAGKRPLCASPFGDVFLLDDVGAVWLLSTLEGGLERVLGSRDELAAALEATDGQDEYLLAGLALAAERAGVVPAADEVYVFTIPPVLGGVVAADNISTMSFVVASSIAAQVHRQVADLPAGTRISGFQVVDPPPAAQERSGVLGRLFRRGR